MRDLKSHLEKYRDREYREWLGRMIDRHAPGLGRGGRKPKKSRRGRAAVQLTMQF